MITKGVTEVYGRVLSIEDNDHEWPFDITEKKEIRIAHSLMSIIKYLVVRALKLHEL